MSEFKTSTHTKGAGGFEGGVMFGDGIWLFSEETAPVDGVSGTGAGKVKKGSVCVAADTGVGYINTGTLASPTWTIIGTQA